MPLTLEENYFTISRNFIPERQEDLRYTSYHSSARLKLILGTQETFGRSGPVFKVPYADLKFWGHNGDTPNDYSVGEWNLKVEVELPKYDNLRDLISYSHHPFNFTITDPVKRKKSISCKASVEDVIDVYKKFCKYAETTGFDFADHEVRIKELEAENAQLKATIKALQEKFPTVL